MKKNTILLFSLSLALVLFNACNKSDNSTTNPTNSTSPYYFNFNMNGTSYNLNANIPQYMPFYENEAGGYEVANASMFPSIGLRLSWPLADTVRESDIIGLVGKTLYFSDTTIHPELSFDTNGIADTWYSEDTANTAYNVKITNVTFLKNDTAFNPLRTYVITGTCSAVMSDGNTMSILTNGKFSFIISRRDL